MWAAARFHKKPHLSKERHLPFQIQKSAPVRRGRMPPGSAVIGGVWGNSKSIRTTQTTANKKRQAIRPRPDPSAACTEKNQGEGNEAGTAQNSGCQTKGAWAKSSRRAHSQARLMPQVRQGRPVTRRDIHERPITPSNRQHSAATARAKGTAFGKPDELLFFLHRAPTPNMLIIGQNETARKKNECTGKAFMVFLARYVQQQSFLLQKFAP